ncbi:MAG: pilus assembly protein [Chloroflexi bacterium]|nr:pilus assembly protein [Chloroflexota bacterium]
MRWVGDTRAAGRGQSVAEFALIAPVFLLMVIGLMEGARVLSAWLVITNEAREAARFGAVAANDPARQPTLVDDVRTHFFDRTKGILDQAELTVTVSQDSGTRMLSVGAAYRVVLVSPLVSDLLPNPFPLYAYSSMRTEM